MKDNNIASLQLMSIALGETRLGIEVLQRMLG
jgi:hypothetical protein